MLELSTWLTEGRAALSYLVEGNDGYVHWTEGRVGLMQLNEEQVGLTQVVSGCAGFIYMYECRARLSTYLRDLLPLETCLYDASGTCRVAALVHACVLGMLYMKSVLAAPVLAWKTASIIRSDAYMRVVCLRDDVPTLGEGMGVSSVYIDGFYLHAHGNSLHPRGSEAANSMFTAK